ncbi:MAG: GNAT family N-acetyltransferase [Chiayiivirga sp.]|jgi:RimJ/RimL family protein N-acetyltransferase|uniref:GNAT family N-acetyltransferase n=1 Tax=Chiayiivirga sp. TaxID=2041042 RepID=UPI0025BB4FCF|nr:GNAT family N-acetyltransferase [Chiayiivirga sp.]MCI1728054.1 GNAT family N-acetyltransferase [Chiayiivirga sp.]
MPQLETARLLLRPPQLQDFDRWAEFAADPVATRFVGGVQPRAMAWRSMMTMAGAWALQGHCMFSVIEKASGRWMGRLGPYQPEGWPGTEVGWSLHPEAWGRGYAREGASAAMDYAFDVLGWDEVIHCIDPNNAPSQRVAIALGSQLRGPGRMPPPFDQAPCEIWGQTRAEWRARPR